MTSNHGHLTILGICTAILVLIALYYARVVLAPMPKLVAAATTVLLVIVVVTILATLIGWGFGRAARWLLADLTRQSNYTPTH